MTVLAGQLELFPVGWQRAEHGPDLEIRIMKYEVEGAPRTLTWQKSVCWCGAPSCDLGWRR